MAKLKYLEPELNIKIDTVTDEIMLGSDVDVDASGDFEDDY